jgi:hypothetical protein
MQANITMVYNASFAMASPSASNMSLLTLRPGLNSSAVAAAGSNSSLLLLTAPSNTTLGSRVYVVLNLRTALGRSLLQVANVNVTVTGRHAGPCCSWARQFSFARWAPPSSMQVVLCLRTLRGR